MIGTNRTASQIRSAKQNAVGGGRKRCKKGKNCSAACIAANMECLVEMPEPVAVATTKVVAMLKQRQGQTAGGAEPTSVQSAAVPLSELSKRIGQAREEYEDAYGTPGQAAAKAKFDKAVSDYEKAKAAQASTPPAPPAPAPQPTLQELSARVTQAGKDYVDASGTPQAAAKKAEFEKAKADYARAKEAAAKPASASPSEMTAQADAMKSYLPGNYKSTRGLTADQDEQVDTAARMTNYRIDKKLNERQFYDDETNAKIKAANQAIVAPFQWMNENEKAALSLYGQDGIKYYKQVNQMLRLGQMDDSTPEKVKMAEFISGNLRSGLEKLPPAKVEELGRAVSGRQATNLANLKPGDVIEDRGFGSYTSQGNPVFDQFFRKGQPNAAIRILNPKSAREVAPVMEYSSEGEHISMPGTRYRLVSVQEKGVYSRKTGGYIPQYTFEEISE
jgi:hypothetical protein